MFKKIFSGLFIAITLSVVSSPFVLASNPDPTIPPLIDSKDDITAIAESIATWVYRLFFIIAVLYILFAAFTYLTAKDDAAKVKKAQASLKNAVIAIIIALISTGVAALIKSFL